MRPLTKTPIELQRFHSSLYLNLRPGRSILRWLCQCISEHDPRITRHRRQDFKNYQNSNLNAKHSIQTILLLRAYSPNHKVGVRQGREWQRNGWLEGGRRWRGIGVDGGLTLSIVLQNPHTYTYSCKTTVGDEERLLNLSPLLTPSRHD